MSELIKDRGQYTLQEMVMVVNEKGKEIELNILEMNQGFVVSYDTETTTLSGRINIIDRLELVNKYSVIGGNTIKVKLVAGDDKAVSIDLLVYKVEPSSDSSYDARRYTFYITSVDHTKLQESHSVSLDGTVDDQFSKFLKNNIQTKLKFTPVHKPKWPMKFVFNAERGYDIVEFLEARCLSEKNNAMFRFFETFDGYKLMSLKESYDTEPVRTFIGRIESETNTLSYLVYDKLELLSQGDHNTMAEAGGYGSVLSTFDVFNKKHTPNKELKPPKEIIDKAFTPKTARLFRLNYNDPSSVMKDTHIDDITQIRIKQEVEINNVVISIRVPGMRDNMPGDCVSVVVYGVERQLKGVKTDELDLSGKYIITRVDNVFGEQWLQTLTLKRFSK